MKCQINPHVERCDQCPNFLLCLIRVKCMKEREKRHEATGN